MRNRFLLLSSVLVLLIVQVQSVYAQTTEFTYQGNLNVSNAPGNGNFDFEFLLFDAVSGGAQLGSTVAINNAVVVGGVFSVKLNFGNQFISGANRFLEIRVRPSGQAGMTILSPRQMIGSAPYAIKSLGAFNAESATMASNSLQLGGVTASQYVLTTDTRMTDARAPTAGSTSYIQNTSLQQTASNFNISGNGTVGGMLSSAVINAVTQYNLNGQRILSASGSNNVFVGIGAGTSNSSGGNNSFFGTQAGALNTSGGNNAFFGTFAGDSNTAGVNNAFFGSNVGHSNSVGSNNAFFGSLAGALNTEGADNSFFGASAGSANTTGFGNAFFGKFAGNANTTGAGNSFFGNNAGRANTTATGNSFFGSFAGDSTTTGSGNSFFGSASGTSNTTGSGNAFFGQSSGGFNSTGQNNAFFGSVAGYSNTVGSSNSFYGTAAGYANTSGANNAYFGSNSGVANTSGSNNAFFGTAAGASNTTGIENSFFGYLSGNGNTTGRFNSFFGSHTGQINTTGENNAFFGDLAGSFNTSGNSNAFLGYASGNINSTGSFNSFFGRAAGSSNTDGSNNAFFGFQAGNANTTGDNNTMIGANADLNGPNISYATAIGAGSLAFVSNTITLGRNDGQDTVFVRGGLVLNTLSTGGATSLCRNAFELVSTCSSSARYKSNIRAYVRSLDLIRKLRPVSFNWKDGGIPDLGLVAEDVAEVEPLLTTTNDIGEVEGVKYDRVGVVLINAMKEQQAQIEQLQRENHTLRKELVNQRHTQQEELKSLKSILCDLKPEASACKP